MESVPTYSLLLIFYMLLGTVSGTAGALVDIRNERQQQTPLYQVVPLILGLIAYIYVILGMGEMRSGAPIYTYLPVLLMWWAGSRFGKTILPGDWQMAGLHCAFFSAAVAIYHFGL